MKPGTPDSSGFTLIEILIVVIIISILASFTVIGVNMAIKTSKTSNTESMIRQMQGALESYQVRWGDYPPSTLARFRTKLPNDTNNGIESLVACLSSRKKGGVIWQAPADDLYCNADDDEATKNVTDWFFGDTKLREIRDYFGYTLTYLHHNDYAKPDPSMLKYVFWFGADVQEIEVQESAATSTYAMPMKFQITSPGYDGKTGTDDDVRPW